MKMRPYGALTSAFLITLTTGAAQAASYGSDCNACACPPMAAHHAAARPAPARVRRNADAENYAQSFYDYHSASAVSEVLVRRVAEQPAGWQEAPDDAKIRFQPADVGMGYAPPQDLAINDNDFRGGVGGDQGAYNNGGGYGGQVILANDATSNNGPNYNSYGESFQNDPSSNHGQFDTLGMPHGYFPGTPPK